jgi:CubicO group peptidase (beta-lactamase class C family)
VLDSAAVAAIDAAALRELERTGQPGLTLGLTDRDGTLALRVYGLAELASRTPVTEDTLFEIGSIGKTFTALAVLQLAEEGRIELDAAVDRYLSWFEVAQPVGHPPITVSHLLSHTAGIAAGIDGTPEAAFQVWSLRDLPTYSVPGERFHYSNVGYKALGLLLAAVEGHPYPEIVRARILEPLGMAATEPEITHAIRPRVAVGYEYLHDDRSASPGDPLTPATWLETDTADGSIASTAADMCAFARLILREGEGLLSAESFRLMSTPHSRVDETYAYGYGLAMRDLDGHRFIGHGGGMVGYLAALQVEPATGLGVVVLQNGVSSNPMELARNVLRIASGVPAAPPEPEEEPEPRSDTGEPPSELRPLAGRYRSHNPWTTNFVVEIRGTQPWLTFPSAPDGFDDEQPLTPLADGSFRAGEDPGNPETIRFDTVVDGRALRAWLSGWPYYRAD